MPIAQWNVLNRAPDGWSAKGAAPAGAPSAGWSSTSPTCTPTISRPGARAGTPWSKGGHTVPDNCQMLCRDCNLRKGAQG